MVELTTCVILFTRFSLTLLLESFRFVYYLHVQGSLIPHLTVFVVMSWGVVHFKKQTLLMSRTWRYEELAILTNEKPQKYCAPLVKLKPLLNRNLKSLNTLCFLIAIIKGLSWGIMNLKLWSETWRNHMGIKQANTNFKTFKGDKRVIYSSKINLVWWESSNCSKF